MLQVRTEMGGQGNEHIRIGVQKYGHYRALLSE